jgi:hypothetical protein
MIGQMPEVSFDLPSNTAFCLYFNLTTGGASYQKYKVSGNRAYIATANASPRSTNQVVLADMIKMVTTFTLIGS